MSLIVFLFVIGVVMLLLEVFLPGGILGVLGVGAMIAGCVLAFRDYGAGGGVAAVVAALVLTGLGLVLEFVVLPKTALGRKVFLSAAVTGRSGTDAPASVDSAAATSLLGRECEAATVLAPTGVVLLDGRRHEAFCRDGYVEKGARLIVRGSETFRLIVSKT
jgi:membrane-bound serine protease (ClpP class)